mmetsp:Transcript_28699/g.69505  ORF Transcript_28699/g.69505 Transcript_28699/m.69505 type:complete len:170 (-) Transcript_28699:111-620(-)
MSMSTFGSKEEPPSSSTSRLLVHSSHVLASYRDALASNLGNLENETIPSRNFIARGARPKRRMMRQTVLFSSSEDDDDGDDLEMLKFRQAQKRRRDRLTQTRLQNRFSDKRSQTKFHRMKRCCVRSQTKQPVLEEDENMYVPHVNHKSLNWWDCVGDNDLRMARPRWKL